MKKPLSYKSLYLNCQAQLTLTSEELLLQLKENRSLNAMLTDTENQLTDSQNKLAQLLRMLPTQPKAGTPPAKSLSPSHNKGDNLQKEKQ